MIIFVQSGRLGNQIFQYAFLKTIQRSNEKLLLFGFDEMFRLFDIKDSTIIRIPVNVKNTLLRKILFRITFGDIYPLLNKVAEWGLISRIKVKHERVDENFLRETTESEKKGGFIESLTFVLHGYFQSEKFFNSCVIENLRIKDKYLRMAEDFLRNVVDKYRVFVHIRRGDYKKVRYYGKEPLLPWSYYKKLVKWFLDNKENCYFIFLSDEPETIEQEFSYLENKIISRNSWEVDFAIMTLCHGAILSASSFGWWGSYLMKERDVVFVPKYYLGWKKKIYRHKEPIAHFMTEVEVDV